MRKTVKAARRKKLNKSKKPKQNNSKNVKIAVGIIILAAFAVSAFNITGFAANSHSIAFITLSAQLQGSEKTLYAQMSQNSVVEIMPLSALPTDLTGYDIIAISKQAGDTFTDEKLDICKKITDYKKPLIFFSGQFSTVCRLTVGSSMAPPMPWEVVNNLHYPTESYSGTVVPYQATGNLPAVVESDGIIRLIKRSDNDAYIALFLQGVNNAQGASVRKAFFSVPDNEFAFTEQGNNLLSRTLVWLERE